MFDFYIYSELVCGGVVTAVDLQCEEVDSSEKFFFKVCYDFLLPKTGRTKALHICVSSHKHCVLASLYGQTDAYIAHIGEAFSTLDETELTIIYITYHTLLLAPAKTPTQNDWLWAFLHSNFFNTLSERWKKISFLMDMSTHIKSIAATSSFVFNFIARPQVEVLNTWYYRKWRDITHDFKSNIIQKLLDLYSIPADVAYVSERIDLAYARFYNTARPQSNSLLMMLKVTPAEEKVIPAEVPAQPVEAAPQPAAPLDVSARDTREERCLRLALGDFFQSETYKKMKFGKTHWRAVYEAYTEYAEPTFKDFARMLSTLFADKEKEGKLPDENNLSKALEKKQWKDSDKYNMVYKYMCVKMEEYYNMN